MTRVGANVDVCKLRIEKGAEVNALNGKNIRALDIVVSADRAEMCEVLPNNKR